MEFNDALNFRYSVREFSDKKVEDDKIEEILAAIKKAPTAKNSQPQHIYVLKSDEARAKLKNITQCAFNAPVVFMVCGDKRREIISTVSGISMMPFDVAIIETYMMLKTADLGLDSCWVCYFKPEDARKEYNLPDYIEPLCLLFVGYKADGVKPNPRHADKLDEKEYVEYL